MFGAIALVIGQAIAGKYDASSCKFNMMSKKLLVIDATALLTVKAIDVDCKVKTQEKDKLRKKKTHISDLQRLKNFNAATRYGPIFVCSSCDQKMFQNGVCDLDDSLKRKIQEKDQKLMRMDKFCVVKKSSTPLASFIKPKVTGKAKMLGI